MDIDVKTEVMPAEFNPSRRGRRAMVEIEPFLDAIQEAAPAWVCFELDDLKMAGSIMRQLGKTPGVEVASQVRTPEGKNVYARWVPGKTR
jgi:hypothetical protein